MKNEKTKENRRILNEAKNNSTKLHIVLTDSSWRNGFVKKVKADFFVFEDMINGEEPIFFLQLKKVEPYMQEGGK